MPSLLRGVAAIVALTLGVLLGSSEAMASVPLAFPADQRLVPFAVGAAFALPAIVALVFSMLMRFGRRIGTAGAVAVLILAGLALAGQLPAGLLRVAGG